MRCLMCLIIVQPDAGSTYYFDVFPFSDLITDQDVVARQCCATAPRARQGASSTQKTCRKSPGPLVPPVPWSLTYHLLVARDCQATTFPAR